MLGFLHKMRITADNLILKSDVGKDVLQRVQDRLLNRFDVQDYHLAASVLDPNLKNLSYLEDYTINNINSGTRRRVLTKKDVLKHFCFKFGIEDENNNASPVAMCPVIPSTASNQIQNTRHELLDFLMEAPLQNENNNNLVVLSLDGEIDAYLSKTVQEKIPSTIDWWKTYEMEYPRLKKLHEAFLSIPPSSASSERAFKKSSKLLRHDRSNLCPVKVNKMCFINSNISILEEKGAIQRLDL